LKLKSSPQLAALPVPEFKAVAAKAMRQVLVDSARRRGARKRGGSGEAIFVALEDNVAGRTLSRSVEVLMLDKALTTLEALNPRQAKMIEYRFFLGMNVAETANMLAVSESVVERDWRAARAWLAGAIEQGAEA
jgi:RNA polymerase sigma factor (TIGR02999 family)